MTPSGDIRRPPFALSLSRRAPRLHAIVSVNLLKTSRNLLVISDFCASVAEKLLLGLRIDAIRSQLARIPAMIAAEPGRTSQSTLERAGRPHRVDEHRHCQRIPARAEISI